MGVWVWVCVGWCGVYLGVRMGVGVGAVYGSVGECSLYSVLQCEEEEGKWTGREAKH